MRLTNSTSANLKVAVCYEDLACVASFRCAGHSPEDPGAIPGWKDNIESMTCLGISWMAGVGLRLVGITVVSASGCLDIISSFARAEPKSNLRETRDYAAWLYWLSWARSAAHLRFFSSCVSACPVCGCFLDLVVLLGRLLFHMLPASCGSFSISYTAPLLCLHGFQYDHCPGPEEGGLLLATLLALSMPVVRVEIDPM